MPHTWDPDRYLTYADERGRPFVELVSRIGATAPAEVVDLGCGAGNLTGLLAERWPDAHVVGLDSSPEMIAAAQPGLGQSVTYAVADLRDWQPERPVDVLVSNATLQWVPGHLELLPSLVAAVEPGGWFAFQVPGNFDEPSHAIRAELAAEAPYAEHTANVAVPSSHDPAVYYDALTAAGCSVDVWETTYTHVLSAPTPSSPGCPAPAPARPSRRCRTTCGRASRRSSSAGWPRPTRPAPTARCCCRSVGCSRWPGSTPHDRDATAPRPGLLPARRRGGRAPLLRRGPRDDGGREAGRARRPGRRLVPAYDDEGRVTAELHVGVEEPFAPARKAHPALLLPRERVLEEVVLRLAGLGYEVDRSEGNTFPGYRRVHVNDASGNRVELLA